MVTSKWLAMLYYISFIHQVVPLLLSVAIFVIVTSVHPYRNVVANYVEALTLLWLVCLLGLGNTTLHNLQSGITNNATLYDDIGRRENLMWPNALLYFPAAMGLLVFILYHIYCVRQLQTDSFCIIVSEYNGFFFLQKTDLTKSQEKEVK